MDTLESLIEEFADGALRIDCSGITDDDAERIDDILTECTNICVNDGDFELADGSVDYKGYIMHYWMDFQYLGVNKGEDDDYGSICMWRIREEEKRHISFIEFLRSVDVKDVEVEGFDELFE